MAYRQVPKLIRVELQGILMRIACHIEFGRLVRDRYRYSLCLQRQGDEELPFNIRYADRDSFLGEAVLSNVDLILAGRQGGGKTPSGVRGTSKNDLPARICNCHNGLRNRLSARIENASVERRAVAKDSTRRTTQEQREQKATHTVLGRERSTSTAQHGLFA